MCPPESIPPAVELNEYSTDESVFKSLMQIKSGSSLPSNVLSDVDPYQFTPSNLPAGVWYFWSGSKTDTENGIWRSTGETRETCSSLITCWRKTLQFYEGTTSEGQKTNLMMQEYTTNDKCSGQKDPRALYKVFFTDAAGSGSGRLSDSEIPVKNLDDVARPSTVANQSPGDYVSRGDYLELDDLAIPLSRSTSADSSCMTRSVTSEDLFDSDALLCELGDDNADHDSRGKLNLSASAKLKEVVVQPTALESLDKEPKPCTGQTSKTNSTPESEPGDRCNNHTSNEAGTSSSSSSSSSEGSSKEERKNRTKKRKMMKYLCFLAF
ncbi:putative transcription factor NAM family [Helianthus annuus]|uniref:Putative NAC domain-containing protein n=1 Tax=Helianthus annuus TaxID=4232 RepID=A0A251RXQ3_HELAN|nr:protein CUP-SHAPED COTYLEDON 2 [Helianthus annuus]KAF5759015.1 putative transcription factor NAM family [Helianthus annuus]KAJ0459596.1 putative transcription factor NAM family [Helianthus annuus]KAJ0638506.1 putative transcription factor NAM family [Helianthus annuus]